MKKKQTGKQLLFDGIGMIVVGKIIYYIIGGLAGSIVTTATDLVGLCLVAIGIIRIIKKRRQKKNNSQHPPYHYPRDESEKSEYEDKRGIPVQVIKISTKDKIEKFYDNLNGRQTLFLLLAGWGWFWIIGELLNGTLLYSLHDWKFNVLAVLPSLLIIILIKDFMKTEKISPSMDGILKLSIIIGILLVAFSFAYYFILRPIDRDSKLSGCLEKAGMNTRLKEDCYKRF